MKRLTEEKVIVLVGEAMEAAGIPVQPPSTMRRFVAELTNRMPLYTGERKPWTRWTEEEEQQLIELWGSGASWGEVMEKLGKTRGQINGAITRLKLQRNRAVPDTVTPPE
jgi:hypothetical protein